MPYSGIKINVNSTPKYSTLNPEISSDSSLIKFIDLRFISAKILMKKQKNIDIKITIFY
jgi:hypothetical protein